MNRPRFTHSPEAVTDLDEIWLFIAKDNIPAAERNEETLRSAMALLARHPDMGHSRSDLTEQAVKFWPVGDYLIVYSRFSDKAFPVLLYR